MGAFDDIPTARAAPARGRAPTAVQNRRLQMGATAEGMESADVNQAQGRTSLAVDTAVIPSDIQKRRADSTKAQIDALEANVRSRTPGGFATAEERQTAYHYGVLQDSENRIRGALMKDKKAEAAPLLPELMERIPLGDVFANYITDPERRIVRTNQMDMLDSALWLTTGAAYTPKQLEIKYRGYFPQPGDDPATRKEKAEKLNNMIALARRRAAMGLSAPGGDGPAGPNGPTGPSGPSGPKTLPAGMSAAGARAQAKAAIAAGKPRDKIIERLRQMGVDVTGL